MPIAARHPCAITSCKAVIHTKYCKKHKYLQSDFSRETRGTTTQQGYGTQWQKIRARYISLHPLCTDCETQGITRPAKEVHHKLELRRGGTNEDDNLQSLCKPCHSKRTRMPQDAIVLSQRVRVVDGVHPAGGGHEMSGSFKPSER